MSTLSTFAGGGGSLAKYQFQLFTSSGTFTLPAKLVGDTVQVTGIGGGQGGSRGSSTSSSYGGNSGEATYAYPVVITADVSVVVGAGGARRTGSTGTGTVGGNSTFSTLTLRGGSSTADIGAQGGNDSNSFLPRAHSNPLASPEAYDSGKGLGGGGLIIDAVKYGTGGTGDTNSNSFSTDGESGVVLVEWMEEV